MSERDGGPLRSVLALIGGGALSFAGLGLLWIGTPWPYQTLMSVPFFLLAFALARTDASRGWTPLFALCGAAPIGSLIMRFRDSSGSHLFPVLIVCGWIAGTLAGLFLGRAMR